MVQVLKTSTKLVKVFTRSIYCMRLLRGRIEEKVRILPPKMLHLLGAASYLHPMASRIPALSRRRSRLQGGYGFLVSEGKAII